MSKINGNVYKGRMSKIELDTVIKNFILSL